MIETNVKTKNILLNYIKQNKVEYFSLIIAFFIGIVIGVMCINNLNQNQKIEISEYINNFVYEIKENNNINIISLLKDCLKKNLISSFILWFVGLAVISIPLVYLYIAFRGFTLGYTIASIVAILGIQKGLIFALCGILFQNIIFIPCILSLGVSGIKFYKFIKNKNGKIKTEIYRHTLFSIFILIFMILSAIFETFISSNLLIQYLKYL